MRLTLLILFISPALLAAGLPYFDRGDLTPYWMSETSAAAHNPAEVASFHALDQNGAAVTERSFNGGLSLVNFFFATCGNTCPRMMSKLRDLEKRLGKNIDLYSFSITPETDSPAVLREYAKSHHLDGAHWKLLTGDKAEIYRVGRAMFKADRSVRRQESEDLPFVHSENVYLVDADRKIRGIYDTASEAQLTLLEKDVRVLWEDKAPAKQIQ